MKDVLWLQNWYQSQCDGQWEKLYGIDIGNIDTPGWEVLIDLTDTNLLYKEFEKIKIDNGDSWLKCYIENERFYGYGGPDQLNQILLIFKQWVKS